MEKFECKRCGECCHQPIAWTNDEIQALTQAGLAENLEFIKMDSLGECFIESKFEGQDRGCKSACSFLEDEGRCCGLHELGLKPQVCKDWSNSNNPISAKIGWGCRNFCGFLAVRWK